MPWLKRRLHRASVDLAAMEQSADARLADAEQARAAEVARRPAVDEVHSRTQQLRKRNQWAALIEDVMGGP